MEQRVELPKEAQAAEQRRSGSWLAWLAVLAVIASGGYWWWQRSQPTQQPAPSFSRRSAPPAAVGTATISTGNVDVTLDALGTVTSLATVTVRTQVTGQLVQIAFKEGQDVKKGDLLAKIDSRSFEASLGQAVGQLARDQALLDNAKLDLTRAETTVKTGATTRQAYDTQAALVTQYQGTLASDLATVQAAKVNLSNTSIVSPVDGRAGLRLVDEGNYVTPGDANGIVVITRLQPISVLFTVPEDQLSAIRRRLGQGATLPVTAFDRTGNAKLGDGQLETFDSAIDPTTGTIKLRATFANEDHALFPNQFVNIRLLVDTHADAIIAPTAAVQRGAPGTFVYVVNADSTVSVRTVTLGTMNGEKTQILSGLKASETVVVDGVDRLRDGMKINAAQPGNDAATPPVAATPPAPQQGDPAKPDASAHKHGDGKHRRNQTGQSP